MGRQRHALCSACLCAREVSGHEHDTPISKQVGYLPENFIHNTIVHTGTPDNATTREWYEELPADQRQNLWSYLKRASEESAEAAAPELIRLAWSSPAALAMAPFQDRLNLGSEGRMNLPGHADGNWRWRFTEEELSLAAFQWLQQLTETSNRLPAANRSA